MLEVREGDGMKPQPAPIPRLALSRAEAAAALGMSLTAFQTHVQPHLQIVRRGSLRVIPVSELERWLQANAEHLTERKLA